MIFFQVSLGARRNLIYLESFFMFYDEAVVLIKTEDVINQLTFG